MPATRTLKTDWKRIGRSGPTTDGRNIDPQMLLDAAETYDKERFTALIWPDHYHWINYGLVEELKAEKNNEDGVDLFAILSPNQMYLQSNSMGQRLFLSMELLPDFAKTGKTYLTGLAATDDPASLGTSEMRFSAEGKKAGLVNGKPEAITFAAEKPSKTDESEALSLLSRLSAFFKSTSHEDDDMADKAELDKLKDDLAALTAEFAKLKPADHKADEKPEEAIAKLSAKVEELAAKVEKLGTPPADEEKKGDDDAITKLSQQLEELTTKFNKALEEAGNGGSSDHAGGEGDPDKFKDIY